MVLSYLKKYYPMISSAVASAGVVATTVTAVAATPKAIEKIHSDSRMNHDGDPFAYTKKEAVRSAWKYYVPTMAIGLFTIACIVGSATANECSKVALAGAYALTKNSYSEYRNKVKELYGDNADKAIKESILREKCDNISISAPGGWFNSTLDFGKGEDPELVHTFYDSFSDRYFQSSIDKVLQAEYHLNRNFALGGEISVNDFYDFLGLAKLDVGDTLGWSASNGDIYWIDFDHRIVNLDDGEEIYVIDMVFEPYLDWVDGL